MHALNLLSLLAALPLGQAANLLTNGNFESGTWGQWKVTPSGGGSNQTVVSPGYKSKYAGAHVVTTRNGSFQSYYPTINGLNPGVQYRWSVDYRLNNGGCTTEFANNEGSLMLFGSRGVPVKVGAWGAQHGTFFAQLGNESLTLATYCNVPPTKPAPSGAVAEFDNFVLEPVSSTVYSTSSPPTGPNLVVDPNLESGTLKAYNISNSPNASVTVASPGYNGAKNAFNITERFATPVAVSYIFQALPDAKKDAVYKVGAAIRILKAEPRFCYIQTYIQQTGFNPSSDVSSTVPFQGAFEFPPASQVIPPVGTWAEYSALVSGNANGFELGITAICVEATAKFEIGDLQVVPLS